MVVLGIDIGATKTISCDSNGEILLAETGSKHTPTLLCFKDDTRLFGEQANFLQNGTIKLLSHLIGMTPDEVSSHFSTKYLPSGFIAGDTDLANVEVNIDGNPTKFNSTALFGMIIANLYKRIIQVHGEDVHLTFVLPPASSASPSLRRAYIEACAIAGVKPKTVEHYPKLIPSDAAIIKTYERKLNAITPVTTIKTAVIFEMGQTSTSICVVKRNEEDGKLTKLASTYDNALGTLNFDIEMFEKLKATADNPTPGSKRGLRLLLGCERLRKLLSQLNDASIMIENVLEDGDKNFKMNRRDLAEICAPLLSKLNALMKSTLNEANIEASDVDVIELLGGGSRMQIVQQVVITDVFGSDVDVGAKLDDSSLALGAALIVEAAWGNSGSSIEVPPTPPADTVKTETDTSSTSAEDDETGGNANPIPPVVETPSMQAFWDVALLLDDDGTSKGLSDTEAYNATELELQKQDQMVVDVSDARNMIEASIFKWRSAIESSKHKAKIDSVTLTPVLNEAEEFLYSDVLYDKPSVVLPLLKKKLEEMDKVIEPATSEFVAIELEEKRVIEKELEVAEAAEAAEKAANGEEDQDHDNRKLKKADRMRLVMKNKEEGTELFKGTNWRPAAARYHKALTHAAKFFDLKPDDEQEVKAIKLSLYLNLAMCYIKMEQWERVTENCKHALDLEPKSAKALFRRSQASEARKDYTSALEDLKQAKEYAPDDAGILKAEVRINKLIAKEKAKEKKMYGNIFG